MHLRCTYTCSRVCMFVYNKSGTMKAQDVSTVLSECRTGELNYLDVSSRIRDTSWVVLRRLNEVESWPSTFPFGLLNKWSLVGWIKQLTK